jgi:hypothetical protein
MFGLRDPFPRPCWQPTTAIEVEGTALLAVIKWADIM